MSKEEKFKQGKNHPENKWNRAEIRRATEGETQFDDFGEVSVTIASSPVLGWDLQSPDLPEREAWLNGWERNGDELAWADQCAGCGEPVHYYGGGVHDPDWTPPEKTPDFPFNPRTCPLCALRQKMRDECHPKDRLTERLERLAKARAKE